MTNRNEYQKKYYSEHKEQFKEYNKRWYEKNKDKMKEWRRKYYLKNKEKIYQLHKEWIEKNKDKNIKLINKSRNKRANKLREQGCTNPWSVISKGADPKYKDNNLIEDIIDLMGGNNNE